MNTTWQDVRYAVRKLLKSPGFAAVAVLSLALGIGANTAIFSVVNSVLLRPLGFEDPDGLVMVWERNFPRNRQQNVVATVNYLDWKDQNRVFEGMAAFGGGGVTLTNSDGPERISAAFVSPDFFKVIRADAALGRVFLPEEGEPGNDDVVVLSHRLWQRNFGGDREVIGRTLILNGQARSVVGVMPPGFEGVRFGSMTARELWVPLALGESARSYNGRSLLVLARLRPSVTLENAQAEMTGIGRRLEEEHEYNSGWGVNVVPLHEQVVGEVRTALLVVMGAVGIVLLIACVNVANLLLARASGRQREIAVRTALGAGRGRLVRQMLTESALLASLGGAAGLLLAVWGVDLLVALSPGDIPRAEEIGVSSAAIGFTLTISVLAALLVGLVPAAQSSKPHIQDALKEGGRGTTEASGRRTRNALVVAEMALAVVTLIAAGLLIRSFWELRQVDPGFKPENVISARISLPGADYSEVAQRVAFFQQLIESVETLPGVQSAAATIARPLGTGLAPATSFYRADRPDPGSGARPVADIRMVTPGYFQTMGIPLLRGRDVTSQDDTDAPPVIVVSETLARTIWPGDDAVGKRLVVRMGDDTPREVVGVVGDVRHGGLDIVPRAKVYYPQAQLDFGFMDLVVRSDSDPAGLSASIRREVAKLDVNLPVYSISTMRDLVSGSYAEERFNMQLLGLFAALALLLGSIGTYGVLSHSVGRRTHEIGIRMALGSERSRVLQLVVSQGMSLAAWGIAFGLAAAFAVTHLMSSLLYGVSAIDPITFIGVPLLLGGAALAACLLPAWRAARVDPVVALKYE